MTCACPAIALSPRDYDAAPVRTLFALKPSAARCAAQPLTAFWHDPSASSAWRMNIDSVIVGGVQPLGVLGQQRFGRLDQRRARQCQRVEELHRLGRSRPAPDTASLSMHVTAGITIHWRLAFGKMVWELGNNHPINPWVDLLPSHLQRLIPRA